MSKLEHLFEDDEKVIRKETGEIVTVKNWWFIKGKSYLGAQYCLKEYPGTWFIEPELEKVVEKVIIEDRVIATVQFFSKVLYVSNIQKVGLRDQYKIELSERREDAFFLDGEDEKEYLKAADKLFGPSVSFSRLNTTETDITFLIKNQIK